MQQQQQPQFELSSLQVRLLSLHAIALVLSSKHAHWRVLLRVVRSALQTDQRTLLVNMDRVRRDRTHQGNDKIDAGNDSMCTGLNPADCMHRALLSVWDELASRPQAAGAAPLGMVVRPRGMNSTAPTPSTHPEAPHCLCGRLQSEHAPTLSAGQVRRVQRIEAMMTPLLRHGQRLLRLVRF
jgi:hypothetical protein